MPAKDGGRKWTEQEENLLRKRWLAGIAMDMKPISIARQLATELGRSYHSVVYKVDKMRLTRARGKVINELKE